MPAFGPGGRSRAAVPGRSATSRSGRSSRGAREDQLGADAADLSDRSPSLDGLEGARSPRPLAPAALAQRQSPRRYEWAEAGALLHIDAYSAAKFDQPGHWATGDRAKRSPAGGKTVVIGVHDDHTRLAYCELHSAENAVNVSATLRRGARWFQDRAAGRCRRSCPTTRSATRRARLRRALQRARRPPHPDPAIHTTLEREDRALLRHAGHRVGARPRLARTPTRDRALSSFLRFYNRRRPHSAAGGRPPISRVHQVRGQDS